MSVDDHYFALNAIHNGLGVDVQIRRPYSKASVQHSTLESSYEVSIRGEQDETAATELVCFEGAHEYCSVIVETDGFSVFPVFEDGAVKEAIFEVYELCSWGLHMKRSLYISCL